MKKIKNVMAVLLIITMTTGFYGCGNGDSSGSNANESANLYPMPEGDPDDSLWGYVDSAGDWVIEPQFEDAEYFHEDYAVVVNEDWLYGYIDKSGKYVIEPRFEDAYGFSEGLAAVSEYDYEEIEAYTDADEQFGSYPVYGYIDKTGEYVIEPQFTGGGDFVDGIADVDHIYDGEEYWWWIDKTGNLLEEAPNSLEVPHFYDGLAAYYNEYSELYGYINESGEWIIKAQFQFAGEFSEGLAVVGLSERDGPYGYIDETGSYVIEPHFTDVGGFWNGLAYVENEDEQVCGYIDKEGNWVIKQEY